MKIIIGIIVLALIYFIYKKMTSDKSTPPADVRTSTDNATEDSASTTSEAAVKEVDPNSVEAATASATQNTDSEDSPAAASATTSATAIANPLPLEHLVGIDRRAGKALRALGITDMNALLAAGAEKLDAAGFDSTAAKALQAQAALSALPGVTPHEASVLANSGIDSIATLASHDPAQLLGKVAQANRGTGALKSAPGVQQLQRLINTAKSAA